MSVIAIARGTLTATLKLGDYLAKELNYTLITREEVYEAAKKYGIEDTGLGEVAIVDQSPPSLLHRFTSRKKLYLACFQTALMDFALKDNLIYIGHLAHLLLADYRPVLRVRMAARDEYRIQKLNEERGLSRSEAVKLIKDIDERRIKWSQFLYGVDWRDPVLYDLVINPEKMSIETAGQLVVKCTECPEFQATPEDISVLKNLRLSSVVKLMLKRSPRTKGLDLSVQADAAMGEVRIYGKVPHVGSETWEQDIRSIVQDVEGVKRVIIKSSVTQVLD